MSISPEKVCSQLFAPTEHLWLCDCLWICPKEEKQVSRVVSTRGKHGLSKLDTDSPGLRTRQDAGQSSVPSCCLSVQWVKTSPAFYTWPKSVIPYLPSGNSFLGVASSASWKVFSLLKPSLSYCVFLQCSWLWFSNNMRHLGLMLSPSLFWPLPRAWARWLLMPHNPCLTFPTQRILLSICISENSSYIILNWRIIGLKVVLVSAVNIHPLRLELPSPPPPL